MATWTNIILTKNEATWANIAWSISLLEQLKLGLKSLLGQTTLGQTNCHCKWKCCKFPFPTLDGTWIDDDTGGKSSPINENSGTTLWHLQAS